MRGVLTGGAPFSLAVGGASLHIDTDWRTWVDVSRVLSRADVPAGERAEAAMALAFDRADLPAAMRSPQEALDAIGAFLACEREPGQGRPPTRSQRKLARKRLFDWDWDGPLVVADFQREYGIDLTDPACSMHWWRFKALFDGLSDTSRTMRAIGVRAADLDAKGMTDAQRSALREQKAALMLPARTREEAAANGEVNGASM